jgi:hypothetical protein
VAVALCISLFQKPAPDPSCISLPELRFSHSLEYPLPSPAGIPRVALAPQDRGNIDHQTLNEIRGSRRATAFGMAAAGLMGAAAGLGVTESIGLLPGGGINLSNTLTRAAAAAASAAGGLGAAAAAAVAAGSSLPDLTAAAGAGAAAAAATGQDAVLARMPPSYIAATMAGSSVMVAGGGAHVAPRPEGQAADGRDRRAREGPVLPVGGTQAAPKHAAGTAPLPPPAAVAPAGVFLPPPPGYGASAPQQEAAEEELSGGGPAAEERRVRQRRE